MVKSLNLAVCPSITIETGNFVLNICNFPHKISLRVLILSITFTFNIFVWSNPVK